MSWYQFDETTRRLTVKLHVQPNAKRSEIAGIHGEALKVKVAAPAVDGKANAELMRFLATTFGVPVRQVRVLGGERARDKLIEIESPTLTPAQVLPA